MIQNSLFHFYMLFNILTIFPDIFNSYFSESILGRAQNKGLVKIKIHNLRDYTRDKHKTTDDVPYGGGAGMVMKIEPIYRALKKILPSRISLKGISRSNSSSRVILLSSRGKTFNQKMARDLSHFKKLVLICGHYEGVDQRVADYFVDEEISIGNFVLTGGELPAMVIVDAVSRLIPGVLGNEESLNEESFSLPENNIEYPHYTRPENFQGLKVPKVLLSGDHHKIKRWREEQTK